MPDMIFDRARGQRVPVYVWARSAGDATIEQLRRLASQPYVVARVCAMADAHVSSGVAVGTVFATEATVVPRALGGDLGCGIRATRLSLDVSALPRERLDRIVATLERVVPAGNDTHRRGVEVPAALREGALSTGALMHARDRLAPRHLATLGGGNHFLELDRDADGAVWLLVHSGSRGLGGAIAEHHARAAASRASASEDALDVRTPAGAAYLADHQWALAFARANRTLISRRAIETIADVVGAEVRAEGDPIDVHHNYVAWERWEGRELLVHRKGAIAAGEGVDALVPGSMATASWLVRGLGCPLAFGSCSHGAGRVMSRREAHERLRVDALHREMRRIAWPAHLAKRLLEEAPAVYRDLREVLDDQTELVARVRRLEPIAVLKG